MMRVNQNSKPNNVRLFYYQQKMTPPTHPPDTSFAVACGLKLTQAIVYLARQAATALIWISIYKSIIGK